MAKTRHHRGRTRLEPITCAPKDQLYRHNHHQESELIELTPRAALDRALSAAKPQGAEQIDFYNYGHLPLRALHWIEAAIS